MDMNKKISNRGDLKYNIKDRFARMTPAQKLELSLRLYYSARELKEASLKSLHPHWSAQKIKEEVRKLFLYART